MSAQIVSEYVRCVGPRFPRNARLGKADAEMIRRLYLKGWKQSEIAESFGISAGHVNNIVSKRRWK